MPSQYEGLRPVDVVDLEKGWAWRNRRYIEATATAIGAAFSDKGADELRQRFFLADNELDDA